MLLKQDLQEIVDPIIDLVVKKNHDYGNSVDKGLDQFGEVYVVSRLFDKFNRLYTLTGQSKREVNDESIEDTIEDIIGYSMLYLNWRRNHEN